LVNANSGGGDKGEQFPFPCKVSKCIRNLERNQGILDKFFIAQHYRKKVIKFIGLFYWTKEALHTYDYAALLEIGIKGGKRKYKIYKINCTTKKRALTHPVQNRR
jgi:hypothetical protein